VKKIYQREKSYYIRKQFSKFIQPGFNLINGCDHNSLSALSADNKHLVIVIVNEETSEKDITIDFSKFVKTGKTARLYRTSLSEDCKQLAEVMPVVNKKSSYKAPAKSVTTIQLDVSVK
jgi:O-glycosyl hydrolase